MGNTPNSHNRAQRAPIISIRLLALQPILAIFLLAPFQVYLNVNSAPLVIGYVLVGLSAVAVLAMLSYQGRVRFSPLLLPTLGILLAIGLSAIRATIWHEFTIKLLHFAAQSTFYYLILNTMETESEVRKAVLLLIAGGATSAIVGILLFTLINIVGARDLAHLMAHVLSPILYGSRAAGLFANGGYYSWVRPILGQQHYTFRATALFVTPGENGLYSMCILVLALAHSRSARRGIRRLALILSMMMTLNIVLSQVRGVWVGTIAAIAYYAFRTGTWSHPSRLLRLGAAAALAAGFAIGIVGGNDAATLLRSIFTRQDSSSLSRLETMRLGAEYLLRHTAIVGLGPGHQGIAAGVDSRWATVAGTTHSMYLDTGVTIGGLGLLSYVWLMVQSWREARRLEHGPRTPFLHNFAIGYQCLWIGLMITNVFQGNLFGNPKTNLMIWGTMGLVSVAHRLQRSAQDRASFL